MQKFISFFTAFVLSLGGLLAGAASPANAISDRCRDNSHIVKHSFVKDIPSLGSAGKTVARGGARPDYKVNGWFWWCYNPATDSARIWKIGTSARFPRGTNAARIGFQGVFSTNTWYYSGGARERVVKNAEQDNYMKRTELVNVSCEDGVVSNPGLEDSCAYDMRLRGAWNSVRDHRVSRGGGFYYD